MLLLVSLLLFLVFVEPLGIGIFLLHEFLSPLEGSSLDVFGSLREELTEFSQVFVGAAHENDIG